MAIEIQTRPKEKENLGQSIFSFICAIIIFFLFASFIYFSFSVPKMEQRIETKNREINIIKSERGPLEKEVISYKIKIDNFRKILLSHRKTAGIFELIEHLTHPQVWFSSFSANVEKGEVSLSGTARNFVVLGQQMIILQKSEFIKKINLSGILMDENGIAFSLFLNIDDRVLQ